MFVVKKDRKKGREKQNLVPPNWLRGGLGLAFLHARDWVFLRVGGWEFPSACGWACRNPLRVPLELLIRGYG